MTYRTLCHARGHGVLPSPCYFQDAMPCQWSSSSSGDPASVKDSLGAGSSTLMLAVLHADLQNIAPA